MGFKEDKIKFKEKMLDENLSLEERIANVGEVNPFFFRDTFSKFHEEAHPKLVDAIVGVMRPSWLRDLIVDNDDYEFLELALEHNKFTQEEIYTNFIEREQEERREQFLNTLIPYLTDQQSLKYVVMNEPAHYANMALNLLEEPLTAEEYARVDNPLILYKGIEDGVLTDLTDILGKVFTSKKVMSDPSRAKVLIDKLDDLPEEEKQGLIKRVLGRFPLGIQKLIIDKIGDDKEFFLSVLDGGALPEDNWRYLIEKFDDDDFSRQLALNSRKSFFETLAPALNDNVYRKLWEDPEGRDFYSQYIPESLLTDFLKNDLNKLDLKTQNALMLNYVNRVEPDQSLLLELMEKSDNNDLKTMAIEVLENQETLEKIALDDDVDFLVRESALDRLKELDADYKDVVEVILEDAKPTEDFEEQTLIQNAFRNHYKDMKDHDQKILRQLVELDHLEDVSKSLVFKLITDAKFLQDKIMTSDRWGHVAYKQYVQNKDLLDLIGDGDDDFLKKAIMEAKDEDLSEKIYKDWALYGLKEDTDFGKKALEKYPSLAAWTLKKVNKDTLPEEFVKYISTLKPRSYDAPKGGDKFKKLDQKVPAHKQQLLRLLLTVAVPA